MRVFKIFIVMLILALSIGAVCATDSLNEDISSDDDSNILKNASEDISSVDDLKYSFTDLKDNLSKSENELEINENYIFNNESDSDTGIVIEKSNFTINGNNHIIDANNQARAFKVNGWNVTINDLTITNGYFPSGAGILVNGYLILNNVTFINNYAQQNGGVLYINSGAYLDCFNCSFINNYAKWNGGAVCVDSDTEVNFSNCTFTGNHAEKNGGAIIIFENSEVNIFNCHFFDNTGQIGQMAFIYDSKVNIRDTYVTSRLFGKYGEIYSQYSTLDLNNVSFSNMCSSYSPAMHLEYGDTSITNSRFINLTSNISAGAISIKKGGNIYIGNCEFINTTSSKNAGAIIADMCFDDNAEVIIYDTLFNDCRSSFGGAYMQLAGKLFVVNSNFTNNRATYDGGAIYLSDVRAEINNSRFVSNAVDELEDYPTYGGAIYFDNGDLNIFESEFINSSASLGNAIFAYDSSYNITGTTFINNTNALYTFFDKTAYLNDNNYNGESVLTNNTYYYTFIDWPGLKLELLNNTLNVTGIPSKFDLREYGWVSPVRKQGRKGDCWAFGAIAALESALLKSCGMTIDLSENNMANTMKVFSIYGSDGKEGGIPDFSIQYLISWLGSFSEDADSYDEIGKISPLITTQENIHVQDVAFVFNDGVPGSLQIKSAIMEYGVLSILFYSGEGEGNFYNSEKSSQYINETLGYNHGAALVGWDDDYPKENFLIEPPENGAWILKNSWGNEWGDNGYLYISYYDKTFLQIGSGLEYGVAFPIENTVPYNKNYQYDTGGYQFFDNTKRYCNIFTSYDDDLIAAVGTYFYDTNSNYTLEIYVNDKLQLVQNGVSPFIGYHTVQLDSFIPIKEGDVFKVIIDGNYIPLVTFSRQHIPENVSFAYYDNQGWVDLSFTQDVACLKVYTVNEDYHNTFTDLENKITASGDVLELIQDYVFDNQSDSNTGIVIEKSNFTINGNNHIIDANNQTRSFKVNGWNVTIKDLTITNGYFLGGSGILVNGYLILNNVTFINNYAYMDSGAMHLNYGAYVDCFNCSFINNYALEDGGAVCVCPDAEVNFSNCTFISNHACNGGAIRSYYNSEVNIFNCSFFDNTGQNGEMALIYDSKVNIRDTYVTSRLFGKYGQIYSEYSTLDLNNVSFANICSSYSPAMHLEYGDTSITNSRFVNLTSNISAGAISIKKGGNIYIGSCEFINTTSSKNAGAIIADMCYDDNAEVIIYDTLFNDCRSSFGGAYIQLAGKLFIGNSNFTNNRATYDGGAIYLSDVRAEINNSRFVSNAVDELEDYPTYGGAIYFDNGDLNISESEFINSSASLGNAIFAYDSSYNITGTTFINNTNALYTFFDKRTFLKGNTYNGESVLTNNTYYYTFIDWPGLKLELLNNTLNVTGIPSKFDLREYGWVSPIRNQGLKGACWALGPIASLESSLLKSCGITIDLSANNMVNTLYKFSIYGSNIKEGGNLDLSIAYLLSWLGTFSQDADSYDEIGKISPLINTEENIHIQDAMMISNDMPGSMQIKSAVMKYGALSIIFYCENLDTGNIFNSEKSALYINESIGVTHAAVIVGWDDDYPKENFLIEPPENGAWIVKNSWGSEWGDNGYLYISYYDKTLLQKNSQFEYGVVFPIENTVPYNKNYQYDTGGQLNFDNNTNRYCNIFTSYDDDLIAAVGTYFNDTNVSYTLEIYVNDKLKLVQEGLSPFRGYHTIQLDSFIPIKDGDVFKVIFTSNNLAYINNLRQHIPENVSFAYYDDQGWVDLSSTQGVACLKVYTVGDDSAITYTEDLEVDYGSDDHFVVLVESADGHAIIGAPVDFTINGTTTTVLTNRYGLAGIQITCPPGTYVMTTTYNNQSYLNNVTVRLNLDDCRIFADNITVYYNGGSFFSVKASSADGNVPVSGESVTFKINNKLINATTDDNGVAMMEITEAPGTYEVTTVLYDKNYTNTVSVKLNLDECKVISNDITVDYSSGAYFSVKVVSKDGKIAVVGEYVTFKINKRAVTVKTDAKGIAKIRIVERPGTYSMTALFNGKTSTNKVIVRHVLNAKKVTVKKTASKFTLKATLKINEKAVKGKKVTFKFKGKKYTAKTNNKGVAQKKFKKRFIKKLKKGKYTVKVIYLKDIIKTKLKVR